MIDKEKDFILVLGHTGRVGLEVLKLLDAGHYKYHAYNRTNEFILNNIYTNFQQLGTPITHVINLCAVTTTIKLNNEIPYDIASQTLQINLNLFNSLLKKSYFGDKLDKPKKIINVVSSCSYGESELLIENDYLKGNIHQSIRPHGEAKKLSYLLGKWASRQYGLNVTTLCFNNIVGNAKWDRPESLKVLEALVKKFVDAVQSGYTTVEIWGSGKPRREFIHAKDCAKSILLSIEKDVNADLLNIGCGKDYSIRVLAQMISKEVGFTGKILYNMEYPDGQMKKLLCNKNMKTLLEWEPSIDIFESIKLSVKEYKNYLEKNK